MLAKQKNLRVFHIQIETKEKFIEYFEKNKILLKEFFLLIEGDIDEEIQNILNASNVCFKDISSCNLKFSNVKKIEQTIEEKKVTTKEEKSLIPEQKLIIYDRPIRSGEELSEELPIVVFGRINSGAKLFCSQSVTIYGIIDGLVQCDGDYVVLNGIGKSGNLIFNGEIIEKDKLKIDCLQKIAIKDQKVVIKEI
ncbi:septum site-determining protein MinC [Sulfurospirillum sp. 1307]|jgi:septum site-determining protein MinC